LFFALGQGIVFYLSIERSIPLDLNLVNTLLVLSIVLRSVGGIIFALVLEHKFKDKLKTRYLISVILVIFIALVPFSIQTSFFDPIFDINRIIILSLPLFFTIYFLRQTRADIRKKLWVGVAGFVLMFVGLFFSSIDMVNNLDMIFSNPYFILFPTKLMTIAGSVLIIYAFHGFSFFLEASWQENLISLYIIDKKRQTSLYQKVFLQDDIKSEEVFVGGLVGIEKIVGEITKATKDMDIINLEDKYILIAKGEKIITAMLVKEKDIQHAYYVLRQITQKFETFFWDYLEQFESYENILSKTEIFKPMEMLIRGILKT
jgi:hypothetical protein